MHDPSLFNQPYFFLLESTMLGGTGGWSIAASNPQEILTTHEHPDLLKVLKRSLQERRRGVWIGYLGYEYYTRLVDKVPVRRSDLIPEGVFCWYDQFSVQKARPGGTSRNDAGRDPQGHGRKPPPAGPKSNFSKLDYLKAVASIKKYLFAGDCYQVNLSQRFSCETALSPYELYENLGQISPAPYAAYLNLGNAQILSASPECFLNVTGRRVVTRPIKGTRARGTTPEEDARMKEELTTSKKDRAELLMITDLLRNDLGRVCTPGSIQVPRLSEVESYAQVHHLVSTVEGELRQECDVVDLLRATFPGGSITGAPKIRAMQIIHELERVPRNVYTGTIGVIFSDGSATFNIAIRTMIVRGGTASFWGGGGIIADSDPESEYQETLTKVSGILKSLHQKVPGTFWS